MKVLFSLLDAAVGGGQRVAIDVARRLITQHDEVGLLVPDEGPATNEFRALGATVYQVDLQTLRRTRGVGHASRIAGRYDVLYSHTSVPGEILGARVARRAGISHVVHRHTDPHFSGHPLIRAVQRQLFRRALRATPFIAVAAHVATSLECLGIERSRITVVANGVDTEAVRARADSPAGQAGLVSVGALGRFDRSRGLDTFAEAARLLERRDIHVVIGARPGPFREHEAMVRQTAAQAGLEITDPGPAGVEFLSSLDIVVIPSRYEGSPLTLFEAMALAKAIIASRIPGIEEVLEPTGAGILVPPDDPDAVAGAIRSLLADPARREALGRTAMEVVSREHDLAHVLDRVLEVLHLAHLAARRT